MSDANPNPLDPALRNPALRRFLITLAVTTVYILLPIDAVPEAIVGPVGLIDDAVGAAITAKSFYDLWRSNGWQSRAVRIGCIALVVAALIGPVGACYLLWQALG